MREQTAIFILVSLCGLNVIEYNVNLAHLISQTTLGGVPLQTNAPFFAPFLHSYLTSQFLYGPTTNKIKMNAEASMVRGFATKLVTL